MAIENGIILDLFPPIGWDEESIRNALEIQEEADTDTEESWNFSSDEIIFLARSVAYYMSLSPTQWNERFEIDTNVNLEDPTENGRFIINMVFPEHLEAPASLR